MDLRTLISQLEEGRHKKYPRATEEQIRLTERKLGKRLPNSFRKFLKLFSNGAQLYMIQEVNCVGEENPDIVPIQDLELEIITPEETVYFREGGPISRSPPRATSSTYCTAPPRDRGLD